MEQQVEEVADLVPTEDLAAMVRRMTSDLSQCHNESVKLMKVILNVADALGERGHDHRDTVRNLRKWAGNQLEAMQKKALQ